MRRDEKRGRRWLLKGVCAAGTALTFASVLLLGVPAFMNNEGRMDLQSVDSHRWDPRWVSELCPSDSVANVVRHGGAIVFIRYDSSAPESMDMVVNSVIKDGSERRDTMTVRLADAYGRRAGRHGYVMSETEVRVAPNAGTEECRLLEVYPADTVRGVHAVGIMLN